MAQNKIPKNLIGSNAFLIMSSLQMAACIETKFSPLINFGYFLISFLATQRNYGNIKYGHY